MCKHVRRGLDTVSQCARSETNKLECQADFGIFWLTLRFGLLQFASGELDCVLRVGVGLSHSNWFIKVPWCRSCVHISLVFCNCGLRKALEWPRQDCDDASLRIFLGVVAVICLLKFPFYEKASEPYFCWLWRRVPILEQCIVHSSISSKVFCRSMFVDRMGMAASRVLAAAAA